jgi:hypothetical protein
MILYSDPIVKGVSTSVSLLVSDVTSLTQVSSDPFFQLPSNWSRVVFSYGSTTSNQKRTMIFDVRDGSINPSINFFVPIPTRGDLVFKFVRIFDVGGGFLTVKRGDLDSVVASSLDIIF